MKQKAVRVILLLFIMVLPFNQVAKAAAFRGLVCYDGIIDDKGFNLMASEGVQKTEKNYGRELQVDTFVNTKADKLVPEDIITLATKENFVIGLGDIYLPVFAKIAPKIPDTKFIVIDSNANMKIKNLLCIKFNEREIGFLAGVAAGATTKNKNIGFIGSYKSLPSNQDFFNGYKKGAAYINPSIKVQSDFVGSSNDKVKMTKKALKMYKKHVDIIFQAAGKSGLGLFKAAAKSGKLAIGCDTDQSSIIPRAERPYVLTSVFKRVDSVVFEIMGNLLKGRFTSGLQVEDCSTGGIGYVDNASNKTVLLNAQGKMLDANAMLTLKALRI